MEHEPEVLESRTDIHHIFELFLFLVRKTEDKKP